jgi:hypothetical protein
VIKAGDLPAHIEHATYYQDWAKVARMQELVATEKRRYDFTFANLNALVNVVPTNFEDWLRTHWRDHSGLEDCTNPSSEPQIKGESLSHVDGKAKEKEKWS